MCKKFYLYYLLLFFIGVIFSVQWSFCNVPGPDIYLNYSDLVQLSQVAKPQGELLAKLEKQLNTPIVQQPENNYSVFLSSSKLGEFFRIASWNIERGFNSDRIANILVGGVLAGADKNLVEELHALSNSAIIILNEVDIGLPRTNYENIIKKIADELHAGYVFGTEFIEVDPYQLGIKKFTQEERTFLESEALNQLDNTDKNKFKGLHGNAIISRYPIISAKIIRLPDCYDWYNQESGKISALETIKRGAAKQIFSEKVLTELRHGGRIALVAEILLPNKQKITVVGTHIENRCVPECRVKQLSFLLNRLRDIRNPLILAGDFNTTGADASPTSIKKEVFKKVKDPEFVTKQAILYLTPLSAAQNLILNTTNALRNFKDPTTKHIPVVMPNKERELFNLIKEYRFNDRGTFDTRGDIARSYNGNGKHLSNSNERELKGFKPTFEFEKHLGVAKYKLDWIFVKPLNLKSPDDKKGSYAYAPHFGRTLQLANRSFSEKISDHDPVIVDIPTGDRNVATH